MLTMPGRWVVAETEVTGWPLKDNKLGYKLDKGEIYSEISEENRFHLFFVCSNYYFFSLIKGISFSPETVCHRYDSHVLEVQHMGPGFKKGKSVEAFDVARCKGFLFAARV